MTEIAPAPILLDGEWRHANASGTFSAQNPATGKTLPDIYPVSDWQDLDRALDGATTAFAAMRDLPAERLASFLRRYADGIEANSDTICQTASLETGLPFSPRLKDIELPRTTGQLRQAAEAALDPSWRLPTIDAAANIHSVLEPLGPVAVFGPNNFPLAFNAISGGDFAAAVAAGNPVIAKAHPLHPTTSRLLAECAAEAADAAELPRGFIQMLYAMDNHDGVRLVADARLGAAAFTGSRKGGLALKAAADVVGTPIYLEMSSTNPVFILPGALEERLEEITTELTTSALMAAGQFCTNPGMVLLLANETTETFISKLGAAYADAPCGTLFGQGVMDGMSAGIEALTHAGAATVTGGSATDRDGYAWSNTLLRVEASRLIQSPGVLQAEVFGNATLLVLAEDLAQLQKVIGCLDGNLTGCIYSATDGRDDAAYDIIAPRLRPRVGRLINDKMPTGVAVSPAMNHGGPFPATGHPHFTAVGIPAALRRFCRLAAYDNVRPHRLPVILQDRI